MCAYIIMLEIGMVLYMVFDILMMAWHPLIHSRKLYYILYKLHRDL